MSPELVVTVGNQTLNMIVLLTAPMLLAALAVGLLVSIFQAATQINEMTLTFIPKLAAVVAVLYIAGPWMLTRTMDFARHLFESIPGWIG